MTPSDSKGCQIYSKTQEDVNLYGYVECSRISSYIQWRPLEDGKG